MIVESTIGWGGHTDDFMPATITKSLAESSILLALQNCGRSLIYNGSSFHQAGARAEKGLALVEVKQTSFKLGTTRRYRLEDCKALEGSYGERWWQR